MATRVAPAVAVLAALASIPLAAAPVADAAVLWDLLVTVEVVNAPLAEGEGPVVSGLVVDHAGDPVAGAAVQVRTGHGSASVATASNGTFAHEFGPLMLLPGEHSVNVVATSMSNRMGVAGATFRVEGDLVLSSRTSQLLATPEAERYLLADPGDFAGDPIGLRLYHYYQGLRDRMDGESAAQREIDDARAALDEVRRNADNLTRAALAERHADDGTFGGTARDLFISGLDPSIRTVVAQQINFTAGVFEAARRAMGEVLARGGSLQEARAAYLEAATVPKSVIEDLELANRYGTWSIVGGLNMSSAPAAPRAPAPPAGAGAAAAGNGSDAGGGGGIAESGGPPAGRVSGPAAAPPPPPPPPPPPAIPAGGQPAGEGAPPADASARPALPPPAAAAAHAAAQHPPAHPANSTAPPPPPPPTAHPANSTAPPPPSPPPTAHPANSTAPPPPPAGGARIEVMQSGTTIVLNINGTMTEFLVNGTSVVAKGP